jgi:hypothetical protein
VAGCCKPTLNRHRAYQLQDTIVQRVEEVKMKKLMIVLALALLLVPAIAAADPSYCQYNGDPSMRFSFNQVVGYDNGWILNPPGTYNQPGPDYATIYAGQTITQVLGPYNAAASWVPSCAIAGVPDTLALLGWSLGGWSVVGDPAFGGMRVLSGGAGGIWLQYVDITAPCGVSIGQLDTVIVKTVYWSTYTGAPAPECTDCFDPNLRPGDGLLYYNADTLIIEVVAPPPLPMLSILQDTLTLVDRGTTSAYIPFTICNQDECAPPTLFGYNIKNKGVAGRIPVINQTGSTTVAGGTCKDVYGIIDAGLALACDYDTLTIIAWTPAPVVYDTCVQVIHVIEPEPVPLFTVPVVTILVLALILAAAVFMRRRAVSRA